MITFNPLNTCIDRGIEYFKFNGRYYRVFKKGKLTRFKHYNISTFIIFPMFSIEDELTKDKYYNFGQT